MLETKWNIQVDSATNNLFYVGKNPLITYTELAQASRGLGSLSVKFDLDGVLRRVPLLVRYENAFYPLLPLRVACDYLQVPPEKILVTPGDSILLKDAKPPHSAPRDIRIPIDAHCNMIVNFMGPWERMHHYNFADILLSSDDRDAMEIWAEELNSKIVIISDVSTGSADIGPVPTDPNFPLSGVHANVLHNILNESFLRELSGVEMLLVEILVLGCLTLLCLRFSSLAFSFSSLFLALVYIIGVMAAFFYGHLILNIIRPLFTVFISLIAIVIYRYIMEEKERIESQRQRDFIRDTFGRYLSSEVVEQLLGSPTGLKMKGDSREVTFLVSDLRGFTMMSSSLSPHLVIEIINRYFEQMVDVITRYNGTVNEFMGDGILAFFGAPLRADDDPERAVACSIEMQNSLAKVNKEQRRLNLPELTMGIGINTGEVVVGSIGSEKRASYGAVGTAINTAYRIESFTVGGQVLINQTTYDSIRSDLDVRQTKKVEFKGLNETVTLYDVTGIGEPYEVYLQKNVQTPFVRIKTPLPIKCQKIEGKTISGEPISGRLTHIGANLAKAVVDGSLTEDSNVMVVIENDLSQEQFECYAKVVKVKIRRDSIDQHSVRFNFSALPQNLKIFFDRIRTKDCPDIETHR
jgi:class 3 adenylate cyclase